MSKTTKALAILGVVAGLGVSALPFNAMAAVNIDGNGETPATDEVTVKTTIEDYISIELKAGDKGTFTGGVVEGAHTDHTLDLGELTNGGAVVDGNLVINVKTNNSKGFMLGIGALNGTNLVGTNNTHIIPTGAPAPGSSLWGFKAEAVAGDTAVTVTSPYDDGAYAEVPATTTKIATSAAATDNNGLDTKITFGVSADASQAADEYSQKVTFTATAAF